MVTWESGAQKVSERLISLAEIQHGLKVLDIATGHGEPAVTVAQKVGEKGHVVATFHRRCFRLQKSVHRI